MQLWTDKPMMKCNGEMQDDAAVATSLGLYLNCASAGLYMANYQLVIPTVSRFLQHMGADPSAAGLVIGCCDIASIPVTVGECSSRVVSWWSFVRLFISYILSFAKQE